MISWQGQELEVNKESKGTNKLPFMLLIKELLIEASRDTSALSTSHPCNTPRKMDMEDTFILPMDIISKDSSNDISSKMFTAVYLGSQ